MVTLASSHPRRRPRRRVHVDPNGILNALPDPVLVVDGEGLVHFVNFEAQQFFEAGEATIINRPLTELLPPDSPVFSLIDQAFAQASSRSEYGITLETPRFGPHQVKATAAPMGGDPPRLVLVTLNEVSVARRIDNQLTHRNAARSVTAMARMLAHEVKNPLSGIRGAAQLLEQTAAEGDHELTRLICDEADRIVSLLERMEVFSHNQFERAPVNIHSVLDRVRRVAENGFASHVRFAINFDPSLPPVLGNFDQLVQVFLNLVKNAAEAVPADNAEIALSTAYQRGVSMSVPGTAGRVNLPLVVSVRDNGEGIPEDLNDHLFDPFVTTKKDGSGLGLALVAKIVGDHGGVIGFESRPKRTVFNVQLPVYAGRSLGPGDLEVVE
ncbi:MAG: PAS domain-containing protein [Alphaproteobacteria bacterium]|jgi:two-component system nitrogen regulation sensor histidine kinase GlnL|nr:PAS domain-containing protein [Alphaproteobacteria bacterium]